MVNALAEKAQLLGMDFYSMSCGTQALAVIVPREVIPELECSGFAATFRREE